MPVELLEELRRKKLIAPRNAPTSYAVENPKLDFFPLAAKGIYPRSNPEDPNSGPAKKLPEPWRFYVKSEGRKANALLSAVNGGGVPKGWYLTAERFMKHQATPSQNWVISVHPPSEKLTKESDRVTATALEELRKKWHPARK